MGQECEQPSLLFLNMFFLIMVLGIILFEGLGLGDEGCEFTIDFQGPRSGCNASCSQGPSLQLSQTFAKATHGVLQIAGVA